jgi:hypothetical protein
VRKPERIENALTELEQIRGTIDLIQHEIEQLEWDKELSEDDKATKEKELEADLRKKHGDLTYWASRFLSLMRNNDKYFSEVRRLL